MLEKSYIKASLLAVVVHLMVGFVLISQFDISKKLKLAPINLDAKHNQDLATKPQPKPVKPIITASMINDAELKQEVERLKQIEQKKVDQEQKRKQEQLRQAELAKQKRLAEEAKLAKLKKQLEQEKKQAEKERQAKLAEEKLELEKLKQQKLKEERELAKAKEAAKLEQELQAKIAKEAQAKMVKDQITKTAILIKQKINQSWRQPVGVDIEGFTCQVGVKLLPTGEVVDVSIIKSSGNLEFDRSTELAIRKSSPLPMPTEDDAKREFRDFTFTFKPEIV